MMTMKTREIPARSARFFHEKMPRGKLRPVRAREWMVLAGILGILAALSGCSLPYPPESAVRQVPVRLVTPVGGVFGTTGDVAAETVLDFTVSGRSNLVVAKGSRLRGIYTLTPMSANGANPGEATAWTLSVDWRSLKARGPSRVRETGRQPPFVTVHEVSTTGGLPELTKGTEIPVSYFDGGSPRGSKNYLVPLSIPLRLNEAPEDRREAGPD